MRKPIFFYLVQRNEKIFLLPEDGRPVYKMSSISASGTEDGKETVHYINPADVVYLPDHHE